MKKEIIKIKKSDIPKSRRRWGRDPETQVVPSKKIYKRNRNKISARKAIANGLKEKEKNKGG